MQALAVFSRPVLPRPIALMRLRVANATNWRGAAIGGNVRIPHAERPSWGIDRMITARTGWIAWYCLVFFTAMLCGTEAMAQRREMRVAVSSAEVVEFARPARTVFIADPTIADIQVVAPKTVIVFGRKPGQTTLVAIGEDDKPLTTMQIMVGYEFAELKRLIQQEVPNADIKITSTQAGVLLSGVVPNDETADKVRAAAQRYATDKDAVINRLQVAGPTQVNLRLRVAEVARTTTKQLGFNWEAIVSSGSFAFGLATGRNAWLGGGQTLTNLGNVVPAGIPGAIDNLINRALPLGNAGSPANASFLNLNSRRATVNSLIDALAEEGVVTVLAQPNLTAVSGQVASFLAGGEFPIPVAQTGGGTAAPTITIEFKPFGVRLDFVPTVMSSDRISIKVRPEVSELSNRGAVTLPGNLVIPALNVRRAETTIHLGSGESFAIAGLIQNNTDTDISKYPGLGDLPVIGALFRSSRFQRNETELVIIVTPYVVRPAADGPSLKLPTDGLETASDIERIFLDRLTKTSTPGLPGAIGVGGARLRGNVGFVYQ
jgi:pilus assembly protein CpaC